MSAFYINVIYILINQGDIFFSNILILTNLHTYIYIYEEATEMAAKYLHNKKMDTPMLGYLNLSHMT